MSHEEIWDDSALVESWDEAVAEYKRYHSIHARGEKVEDILKHREEDASGQSHSAEDANGDVEVEDGMIVEEREETAIPAVIPKNNVVDETAFSEGQTAAAQQPAEATAPSHAPPLPPHLVGAVQDEGLKNLLMSWYYAGYYTGLFEGQQKGQQMAKAAEASNEE